MSHRPHDGPALLSIAAAIVAIGTSLVGLLVPGTYAHEAPAWAIQAIGQDVANLLVAAALVVSVIRWRNGSGGALLVGLGCLLYFLYAFAIYAFAVHFNRLFLAYVAVLGFSFYAFVGALARVDAAAVSAALADHPRRGGAANLLIAIGALFSLLWLGEILPNLLANSTPSSLVESGLLTNPVHVLDLALFLPAMIVVGVLAHRRHTWGLLLMVPLLVFAVTMGLAILSLFALSARAGMQVAIPPAIAIAGIVVTSGVYAWFLLNRSRLRASQPSTQSSR